jgi:hypothetical protein
VKLERAARAPDRKQRVTVRETAVLVARDAKRGGVSEATSAGNKSAYRAALRAAEAGDVVACPPTGFRLRRMPV